MNKAVVYTLVAGFIIIGLFIFKDSFIVKKTDLPPADLDDQISLNEIDSNLLEKLWIWEKTEYFEGEDFLPKKEGVFAVTFKKDSGLSVRTDCNAMGGTYEAGSRELRFKDMFSTLMYCEDSDETDFSRMLGEVSEYSFGLEGELFLNFTEGVGRMIFVESEEI